MKRATIGLFALCLAAAGSSGCSGEASPPTDVNEAPPSYHRDTKPLLDRYCNECHQPGGIAPFALTDLADAQRHAPAIKAAVESGRMPPWMPSDKGLPLAYSRKLRPEDKAQLVRWVDGGATAGDPAAAPRTDLPPPPSLEPPRPDLVLRADDVYMPNAKAADDYRCFLVDPQLTEDVFVQASIVRPDNKAIVHHVLVFEISEANAKKARDKDASEPGIGYTCFGGPGVGNDVRVVMGWAPGGVGTRTPGDVALRVRKGSLLVMQVHYNMVNFKGVGDRTETVFEITRTPPRREALLLPFANPRDLKIPAGAPAAKQTISVNVGLVESFLKWPAGEMTVYGVAPHMHLIGTQITTSVEDGPILVDIPKWDFHWQGGYVLAEPYVLRQSDTLRLECTYDNTMANPHQTSNPPRDIAWGEGTTDEMCLSFILATPGGNTP